MKKITGFAVMMVAVLAMLVPMVVFASSGGAPASQPLATAEAAQRAAENAQNVAWSAQATAQAARGQATATAQVEATMTAQVATAQAEATATAQAATVTAQLATAQAEATRKAFEWQATAQALYLEGTREAQALSISATAEVAQYQIQATRQAAAARREQTAADRAEFMEPIYDYGIWVLLALLIVVLGWTAVQAVPLVEKYLIREGEIDNPLSPPPSQIAALSPLDILGSNREWRGRGEGEIIDLKVERD